MKMFFFLDAGILMRFRTRRFNLFTLADVRSEGHHLALVNVSCSHLRMTEVSRPPE